MKTFYNNSKPQAVFLFLSHLKNKPFLNSLVIYLLYGRCDKNIAGIT